MAKKPYRKQPRKKASSPKEQHKKPVSPQLELNPSSVRRGDPIIVRGRGWPAYPVSFMINQKNIRPSRVSSGILDGTEITIDASGGFVVEISTYNLKEGKHSLSAFSRHFDLSATVSKAFTIEVRQSIADVIDRIEKESRKKKDESDQDTNEEEGWDPPYWRQLDWFQRRFGHLGYIPEGVREKQISEIRKLRSRQGYQMKDQPSPGAGEPSQPVPGSCNWTPVGASPLVVSANIAWSGRAISIAFHPTNPSIIYVGTANGGVWKTTDGGQTWSPKSDYQRSLAIGSLAIDPNDPQRIFAGTGQYGSAVGTYYGNGILSSIDGGNTWSELATTTFLRDEISRILFDPTDATSQRMFLSSSTGVYSSIDGGNNWILLRAGSASSLVIIATGNNVQLIAGFAGSGIWTASRTGGAWSAWTQFASPSFPSSFQRIALGQSTNNPQTIYTAFSSGSSIAGMAKTNNGGTAWSRVTPPLSIDINTQSTSAGAPLHNHNITIAAADLIAGLAKVITTANASTGAAHTHTISLTAVQMQTLAAGLGSIALTTDPDASGHSHTFVIDRRISGQTWYNFHISPHPTDPNTVFYGEVRLWKTTTGDGPWTQLPILHTDNHAFGFEPSNPVNVWACCDGGVYRSGDSGSTWAHRNRDLATLEYISVAQHPLWDTILIGGTQDNGTHRFTGSPAFILSDGGDGGFTAIDQANPHRMYHEYIYSIFSRSDSSGDPGSWVIKNGGITGSAEFYAPFALDPSNNNTCYFGGAQLWRSPDNADTWFAITNTIAYDITAIKVHPTDPNTIYVGTVLGKVYRIQKTGMTWNLPDVTTIDITGPNLPVNIFVSDLEVDNTGTIWVTMASVLSSESYGEFTNDHIYRRLAGSTIWESRSAGLVQANPINSIVIDPTNSNRLFCGGDIGVFRTENAGATWVTWDEGLPNAAVFDLSIHNPSRLLRAATHGRSIWERKIDALSCPMVDLYMRDNIIDSGRVQPTPEGVLHPLDSTIWVGHWQSEDIKVDGPEPTFQTPSPISDYIAFTTLQHRTARRNLTNRFYVQVNNRGINTATNVQVRAFFAPASGGLPTLPADFWSAGKPFTGTPSGPNWTPVGPTINLGNLQPGDPAIAEWDWFVPATAPQHSCLLALCTCTEDPLSAAGTFNPDFLVSNFKQVTLKNLHVDDAVMGTGMPPEQAYIIDLNTHSREELVTDIHFRWGSLPKETKVFVAFSTTDNKPALRVKLLDLKDLGIMMSRKGMNLFPEKIEGNRENRYHIDRQRIYQLSYGRNGITIIPSVHLPEKGPLKMVLNFILPVKEPKTYQFDIIQYFGKRVEGGMSYRVNGIKKQNKPNA